MASSSLDVQCPGCERIRNRSRERPFVPPGGSCDDLFYACDCGQWWFQMNTLHHLWQPVTDEQAAAFRRDIFSPSDSCL